MRIIVRDCNNIPITLDNLQDSLKTIENVVIEIKSILDNYSNYNRVLLDDGTMEQLVTSATKAMSSRIHAAINDVINVDFKVKQNKKINIEVRKGYLASLKQFYKKVYFGDFNPNLICKVCNVSSVDQLHNFSTDDIVTICKKVRNKFIIRRKHRIEAIMDEYNQAFDKLDVFAKLKHLKGGNKPVLKSDVLRKYTFKSEAELKQVLANVTGLVTDYALVNEVAMPNNNNSNENNDEKQDYIDQVMLNNVEIAAVTDIIKRRRHIVDIERKLVYEYGISQADVRSMRQEEFLRDQIAKTTEILNSDQHMNFQRLNSGASDNYNADAVNDASQSEYYFTAKIATKKAENLIDFIEGCNRITANEGPSGGHKILSLIDQKQYVTIQRYLQEYASFQCNTIALALSYFESVLDLKNNSDDDDGKSDKSKSKSQSNSNTKSATAIVTYGNNLLNLDEILHIYHNFSKLHEYMFTNKDFQSLYNKWRQQLDSIFEHFEHFLRKKDNFLSNEMPLVLSAVYMLRKIDHCNIIGADKQFSKLYKMANAEFEKDYEEFGNEIKNKNFKAISKHLNNYKMQQLNHGNQVTSPIASISTFKFDSAARLLTNMLTDIYDDISNIVNMNAVDISEYLKVDNSLKRLLNDIREINKLGLISYLQTNASNMFAMVSEYQQRLQKQTRDWYNTITKTADQYITEERFGKAQEVIEVLRMFSEIYKFVASGIDDGILMQSGYPASKAANSSNTNNNNNNQGKDKKNEIRSPDSFENKINKLLTSIYGEYNTVMLCPLKKLDRRNYYLKHDLGSLYRKLQRAQEICKDQKNSKQCDTYDKIWNAIEKDFLQKFEALMKEVNDKDRDLYLFCSKITLMSELFDTLPKCIKEKYEQNYKTCIKTFETNKQREDDRLLSKFQKNKDFQLQIHL